MTRTKDIKEIVGLDTRALTRWIKNRLSGFPGSLPPQISKGEDPEDLVVALHKWSDREFKERVNAAVIDLLKELIASTTSELDLPLLSRLAFLADALEINTAAPLLSSFVFRKELHGKNTPNGDLQELILRSLLGLDPKQFDSRFWRLNLEDPKLIAVAIRGLAVTDPPVAVRSLPKLFELAMLGRVEVDAKLVLWRISSGWRHREFLSLLAQSMKGWSAATQSGIGTAVEELPFEAAAKELFKTIGRPDSESRWQTVPTEDVDTPSLASTFYIDGIYMRHSGPLYFEAKPQTAALNATGETTHLGLQKHFYCPQATVILTGAGISRKEVFHSQRKQLVFAEFEKQSFRTSAAWSADYDEEYSEASRGYGTMFGQREGSQPLRIGAVINASAGQVKSVHSGNMVVGSTVIKTRTNFLTRKDELSAIRHYL